MTHKDVGPAVVWTSDGQRTFAALIDYLAAQPYGGPDARAREIEGLSRRFVSRQLVVL